MPAPLGRDGELAALRGLAERAATGHGETLLLLGEAGIGKTRLLDETAALATACGVTVLRGRAVPGGGTYRPFAEAVRSLDSPPEGPGLRPYLPALGRLRPDWAPAQASETLVDPALVLGEGLLRLLRPAGAVLLLDDLHWADPDSLELLGYLAGVVADEPVGIVAAARDDEPTPADLRHLAARRDITACQLHRLGPADVITLAHQRTGTPLTEPTQAALVANADGLPLFVEELADALTSVSEASEARPGQASAGGPVVLPPTLAALVAGRLGDLPDVQRRIVAAAAVLPGEPDALSLAAVTGAEEVEVVAALRAAHPGLLVAAGGRSRWRHALTRDAVLATVIPAEQVGLARRGAALLLDRAAPGDDFRAAELLALAGDVVPLSDLLLRMAEREAGRGALLGAAALLDRAAATGSRRAEVAAAIVRVRTATGRPGAALAGGMPELARVRGDGRADLCLALAGAAVAAGRWADADDLLNRAGRPGDARVLTLRAEAAYGAGDRGASATLADRAVQAAAAQAGGGAGDGVADAEVWCQALIVRGRSRLAGDPGAARLDFARSAQLAAERAGPRVHVAALIAIATVDLYDHADTPALDLAREVAVDTGQLGQVAAVDLFRAEAALTVQGPQAAAGPAGEVIALTSRLRLFHLQALAETVLAADRAVAADDAGMAALLDAAIARPAAAVEVAALACLVRAMRALVDGDLAAAVAQLDLAAERLGAHGTAAPMPVWGLWAVLRTVQRDRDVAARETVRALPAGQRAVNRAGLFFADAIAAGRAGDRVTAAALLDEGDWRFAEHPWWGRLLRLFTMQAAADEGWADPVPRLRTDLAYFGVTPFAGICRDLLRRAGAPTRRGRGDTPVPEALRAVGVTSREMDVLYLLAQGLTNAEIAERLFLSPRTVDSHVAGLLAKTGAAGRAELRRFLTRRPG